MEMVPRTGLLVLNIGNTPTFRRPGQQGTIPDVTFASERLSTQIENWQVIEDYTGSDHQYITFEIQDRQPQQNSFLDKPLNWNVGKINEDKFSNALAKGA